MGVSSRGLTVVRLNINFSAMILCIGKGRPSLVYVESCISYDMSLIRGFELGNVRIVCFIFGVGGIYR